jgi:hypothetical protein
MSWNDVLVAEFAAVRREAIEECAKVCDSMADPKMWVDESAFTRAAAAIRALLEVPRG